MRLPFSESFPETQQELASDRRIRGASSGGRVLTDHTRLVSVVVVGARRAGDGNAREGIGVDAPGGISSTG